MDGIGSNSSSSSSGASTPTPAPAPTPTPEALLGLFALFTVRAALNQESFWDEDSEPLDTVKEASVVERCSAHCFMYNNNRLKLEHSGEPDEWPATLDLVCQIITDLDGKIEQSESEDDKDEMETCVENLQFFVDEPFNWHRHSLDPDEYRADTNYDTASQLQTCLSKCEKFFKEPPES